MKTNLFDLTEKEYKDERKAWKLRRKIENTTLGLGIKPDHDESGHFYLFNGKRLPSVTAKLQILKDPALMNWKMNRALNHIKTYWFPDTPFTIQEIEAVLNDAALAPQLEFEGAGDIGRKVHDWREKYFAQLMGGNDSDFEINKDELGEVISGSRAVMKFKKDTGYLPLACELYVADEKLGVGGTLDDVGMLNGEIGILDVKTSNIGNKDSYYFQIALYTYMFEKLYKIRTKWHKILHLSKTDGTYKLIDIPNIRKHIRDAKQILKVDNFLQELRQEKKKEAVIL